MRLPMIAFGLAASLGLGAEGIGPDQVAGARRTSEAWEFNRTDRDARGQTHSYPIRFAQGTVEEQRGFLVGTANGGYWPNRDAALVLLTQDPYRAGLPRALENPENRLALHRLGYRVSGAKPLAFLEPVASLERPWVSSLGLHLDPKGWRLQLLTPTGMLPQVAGGATFPAVLQKAPVPSVLIHLKALKPGLARLSQLAGGPEGRMLQDAAAGSRAGFLVRHLQSWLKRGEDVLGPLEGHEAWVLHYGTDGSTLVFLPGDLPARTDLAMKLLRLNPFSTGVRVRRVEHAVMAGKKRLGSLSLDELRGHGGVLSLYTAPGGTWIADRVGALERLTFAGESLPRLLDRQEWGRQALAGAQHAEVSFWMLPKAGVGASQECALLLAAGHPQAWTAKGGALAKAAPRGSAFSAALGGGPTRGALEALWTATDPFPVEDPELPVFAPDAVLSAQQRKDYEQSVKDARIRRARRAELRKVLDQLTPMIESSGAALHWNGWVAAPPLDPARKKQVQEFRATHQWFDGKGAIHYSPPPVFGRFEEPGMSPSAALALPLKAGKGAEAQALLQHLLPLAFKGSLQSKPLGSAKLFRIRTVQAFAPTFLVLGDLLLLGSDEPAVSAAAAGWLGQAPTLADLPPAGWGQVELDGPRIAGELEQLLRAYLGANGGRRFWWEPDEVRSADEVSDEVAASFGPFLDLLKAQGRLTLVVEPGPGGWIARPR